MPSKTLDFASLEGSSKYRQLPSPPGFSRSLTTSKGPSKSSIASTAAYDQLKERRAWDMAIAPAKSLPMQAFMLYMSGGGVQIFSMGIVAMLLWTPFKNIAGINEAFVQFAPSTGTTKITDDPSPAKDRIRVMQYVDTGGGDCGKCRSMGLLPTGTGDWLAFETRGLAPELSLF
ncbi:DUF1077-domain-containing protein [Desarmillaria tabescens]|uniref:ER membrane protein complex subunit 4 n=1 Tax=Armillaria tabescens TaxID=1929756 RepID=A0AA39NFY1_ARMTA|nr:DUF1077-domain-containing protein [Desarmillaria tabescens]KAK0464738.1 DUF1077-domain-containing protein [Desarmillaria tabescens]